ncbi:MAG: LexA repressor [uncultured bacterium]|nr:MAG: LexA repressor [uncultured bacterium]
MVTPIQQKIYEYIQSHINEHGYSPSLVEIARGIGISPKSVSLVSRSIHALVDAGRLKIDKKGYRSVQVADADEMSLPLLGRIAAGTPIEAIEDKKSVDLRFLLTDKNYFALEVKGESMIDEGIFDGDFVICKHSKRAHEGDIVVALIDGMEATLKRISFKIHDRITLIPANPALKPKAYLPHHVQVQGIFIGLLRLKR